MSSSSIGLGVVEKVPANLRLCRGMAPVLALGASWRKRLPASPAPVVKPTRPAATAASARANRPLASAINLSRSSTEKAGRSSNLPRVMAVELNERAKNRKEDQGGSNQQESNQSRAEINPTLAYVTGHANVYGNEKADQLANNGADYF